MPEPAVRLPEMPVLEPKQHSPLLAAGLASKLKTDYIPYGRRFPGRSATGSFKKSWAGLLFPIKDS